MRRRRSLTPNRDTWSISAQYTSDFGVQMFGLKDQRHGIVHVVGPEQGISQPGMILVCADSHTSTHGAVGALALALG